MQNIYLIGFMGCGKTTVAKELQLISQCQMVDTDNLIETYNQMKISEIFATYGEATFRDKETQVLSNLSNQQNLIVSCGGGVALRQENVALMKQSGTIFLLEASAKTIYGRLRFDESRPLLKGKKNPSDIAQMMESRLPYYRKAADITICVDDRLPQQVATEIMTYIG